MSWCPSCREEYIDAIKLCPACGEPLVAHLEKEPAASHQQSDVLATLPANKAREAAALLKGQGIDCLLFPVGEKRPFAPELIHPRATADVCIVVGMERMEDARNVLDAHPEEYDLSELEEVIRQDDQQKTPLVPILVITSLIVLATGLFYWWLTGG